MRFKLDENLHSDAAEFLRSHGHDAVTVVEQKLRGSPDAVIASVCQDEGRILLTLDLDFSDIRKYPPAGFEGIVVLRLRSQAREYLLRLLAKLLPVLSLRQQPGQLWIVDEELVRIRGAERLAL